MYLCVCKVKDIFPLSNCNHKFYDHINFSLLFFNYLHSQPINKSPIKHCFFCPYLGFKSYESYESNYDSPQNDIYIFFGFMEHIPRVLDIDLLHIFNIVVVLQWEMIAYARRNKKLFH